MNIYNVPAKLVLTGNISENWCKFRQSFEIYLLAGALDTASESRKIAILLNVIGEDAISLYNTFKFEEKSLTLQHVLEAFEKYCKPKRNVLYCRFLFYNRTQKENEPFDTFLTDMKNLAKESEFCTDCHDNLLRDRLVFASKNEECQNKLIKLGDPSLDDVISSFRLSEISDAQIKEIQQKESIHALSYKKKCSYCGYMHNAGKCPAFNKTCAKCQKKGHFAKMCKTKTEMNEINIDNTEYYCGTVETNLKVDSIAWFKTLLVEKTLINFKLDPGADVSIISEELFNKVKDKADRPLQLKKSSAILESWNGFKSPIQGVVFLKIQLNNKEYDDQFCIAGKNNSTAILSRDACVKLNLVKRIDEVITDTTKEDIMEKNKDLFSGIGKIDKPYDILLKQDVIPTSKPPYRIPLKLRPKLQDELNKLVSLEIVSKVDEPSEWVNRVAIVEKPDGSIRLCLDPQDLNEAIVRDYCTIPTLGELSSIIGDAKYFCVLDLKDSFWHIVLTENSSKLCTFATMYGTYKFNRLPFGIAVASEVFQKYLSEIFCDIPGVINYIDDILLFAKTIPEMNNILHKVFNIARQFNIKFNCTKFQYMVTKVQYLGHIFENGTVKPDPESIKAVLNYDIPNNKSDLQRLLGMVNYLRPFIPNLSELTSSLRELLKKNTIYDWQKVHLDCFERIKNILCSKPLLNNFNPNKTITIQTDASKSGIGCVLLQENKPICYASKSLTQTEENYGQIEKEFMAVLFACRKFHTFIYGRKIIVQTDHLPLIAIMKKELSKIPSTRLQRIKLKLSIYDIEMTHIPGNKMHIADALSRACSIASNDCDSDLNDVVHSVNISNDILTMIEKELLEDDVAKKLTCYIKNGWPCSITKVDKLVKNLYNERNSIYCENGLIFINTKVYVPKNMIHFIMTKLHDCHFGMVKTKARAKMLFYWIGMNTDIDNFIAGCQVCKKFSNNNVKEPMIIRDQPELPFQHVSVDLLQFGSDNYLVLVDNYSKWIELVKLSNKSAENTIIILKNIFSIHGIPELLYCDNVPFNSWAFLEFSRDWQFKPIFSSPHYHQSNGAAEKAVGICKSMLKKCSETNSDIKNSLLEYRNTPVCGTNYTPSQLLFNRVCRTKLPVHKELLKPKLTPCFQPQLFKSTLYSKKCYDRKTRPRNCEFKEGQRIFCKENENCNIWKPGVIIKSMDNPRSVMIEGSNGVAKIRNTWFIKSCQDEVNRSPDPTQSTSAIPDQKYWSGDMNILDSTSTDNSSQSEPLRRSERSVRPPIYLNDYNID